MKQTDTRCLIHWLKKQNIFSGLWILLMISLLNISVKSQTFYGGTGSIQNGGQSTFYASVSGLDKSQIDSTYGIEEVCIDISESEVNELTVSLQSPSGTIVWLTMGSSCHGTNYSSTCFNSSANTSITLGSAPYSGTYRPVGYLGRFNTGQNGNGTWKLIVKDWPSDSIVGNVNSWSIKFGYSPPHPVVFTSSNLPIVILNASQPIGDSKILANMGIIDNGTGRNYVTDPHNVYDGKIDIDLHGHSTKNFEKKSFHIETTDQNGTPVDVSLMGMPAEHQWELIATYQDKTHARDPLAGRVWSDMGHYAPRYRNVELVLNGEYYGIYEITEKIKRDSNRVHVKKLEPTENSWPDISGGYIILIDRNDSPGWTSMMPGLCQSGAHFYYQYVYPDGNTITSQQANYIKSYLDSIETVMNSSYYPDPQIGYKKYIHVGSAVDYLLLNEFSRNVDAFRFSSFMYKDHTVDGGKLHFGPEWDYNIAWHNSKDGNTASPYGWQFLMQDNTSPAPTWWMRFMQDSVFINAVTCRWQDLRANVLSNATLLAFVDSMATALDEAQQRNFIQWPVLGAYIQPNPQNQNNASFQSEVDDLKNWIVNRGDWLDVAIWGHCNRTTGTEEAQQNLVNGVKVFPNPMQSSTTFQFRLTHSADVSLCVLDALGNEVARFLNSHAPAGESTIDFNRKQLPAGVYFYQAQIETEIVRGKIIIQ
jgi:subtilisin-like proprotein convertase family protein/spore coat protein CotH